MLYSNCILTYNSIRHERFFDIIEFMCKFTIKLKLKSKIKQFEH